LKEGLALVRASVQAQSAMQAQISFTHYLSLIADIHCKAGEPDEGLTVLDEAFRICGRTGETFFKPELLRIQGELLLRKGAPAEAESCFLGAIELAQAQQAKFLELRATSSLCRLWREQGRSRDARPLLAAIYDWFTEGQDTADLREARDLLNEL
jgi:predicted ATPase